MNGPGEKLGAVLFSRTLFLECLHEDGPHWPGFRAGRLPLRVSWHSCELNVPRHLIHESDNSFQGCGLVFRQPGKAWEFRTETDILLIFFRPEDAVGVFFALRW